MTIINKSVTKTMYTWNIQYNNATLFSFFEKDKSEYVN